MSRSEIMQRVKEAVGLVLSIDASEIADDANLKDDLDLDSLGKVEVIVELERMLGAQFPETSLAGIHTVQEAVDLVEATLEEAGLCAEVE